MENELDSIVFEGEGEPIHVRFTESEIAFSHRLIPPDKNSPHWREIAFFDGKWHHPIYRNYGIPNG